MEENLRKVEDNLSSVQTKQAEMENKVKPQEPAKEQPKEGDKKDDNANPNPADPNKAVIDSGKTALKAFAAKYNSNSKEYLKENKIDIEKIYKEFVENAEIVKLKEQGTWELSVSSKFQTRLEFVFDKTKKGQQQPAFDIKTLKQQDNSGKERVILQFDNPNVKVFEVTIENNKEIEKEVH